MGYDIEKEKEKQLKLRRSYLPKRSSKESMAKGISLKFLLI